MTVRPHKPGADPTRRRTDHGDDELHVRLPVLNGPKTAPRRVRRGEATANPSRRDFFKLSGVCMAAMATAGTASASSDAHERLNPDRMGVLVDLAVCVGCRRCEWACNDANGNPNRPLESFDDPSVFNEPRRPSANRFTVVRRIDASESDSEPTHYKVQCMHCEHPPCASACLVGALEKQPDGRVTYDPGKCIGCRYCMVACPFQLPAYEYEEALTPRVRKCEFCGDRTSEGKLPACVEICPVEALQYGKRSELLAVAHERIRQHPDRYVDHVYGEHEAGGTSWLYLSNRPFQELGFPNLAPESPARLSEKIQHGIFKGFAAPLLLAGLLVTLKKLTSGSDDR